MQLDERKFMILKAIIDDYVLTGMPVGSRTISRKSGVGFSPATIRNEMSDLEELGYLDQPHTSAGRVPSHKAYRLYVDRLLQVGNLSPEETKKIQAHLRERTSQVQEVIRSAGAGAFRRDALYFGNRSAASAGAAHPPGATGAHHGEHGAARDRNERGHREGRGGAGAG